MKTIAFILLFLAGCACEPHEHAKPGWPWHDTEHLGFLGMPTKVAPEPLATVERFWEWVFCP